MLQTMIMFKTTTTVTALEAALLAACERFDGAEVLALGEAAAEVVDGDDYQGEDLFGDLAA